ncbi:MAG: hypothetical protein CL532_01580 [Aestuariivita sp.]|nr:hypothetical protein [Aestuariivita sp.]|tara:strand:+ start:1442 stop:1693 length:252 start_codon:yes stop_codon:yes gene_type:complete
MSHFGDPQTIYELFDEQCVTETYASLPVAIMNRMNEIGIDPEIVLNHEFQHLFAKEMAEGGILMVNNQHGCFATAIINRKESK